MVSTDNVSFRKFQSLWKGKEFDLGGLRLQRKNIDLIYIFKPLTLYAPLMFWSICLVFCPTRKSLDWDLWVSGSLNKNMIDAGVGAVVGPEREKQKINKTERWARLVTHTGHSVLSQECVRGILTITNVGLSAGWLFPWLYDLHFVHGNIMGLGDLWHCITSDMWTMSKYDGKDKVLCNHLINNVINVIEAQYRN